MQNTEFSTQQGIFVLLCLSLAMLCFGGYFHFKTIREIEANTSPLTINQAHQSDGLDYVSGDKTDLQDTQVVDKPLPTPEIVKGIYLTGYTFSSEKRLAELTELIQSTELNSMVIDIKDPNGKFMFHFTDERLNSVALSSVVFENDKYSDVLAELQEKEIYTIARVVTFQDDAAARTLPEEALKNKSGTIWENWNGITWLDLTNPKAWEIPVLKAKEAIALGFDEIQFDYIRFPSDGNTNQIQYHDLPAGKYKYEVLADFFAYLDEELKDVDIPISIDLFGLTYHTREDEHYDLGIGQRLVDAAVHFDHISPMVYPSHYPAGYLGYANPAAYPYQVIDKAMKDGNQIIGSLENAKGKTRPWIQDFDMGANYDASMVRAQIKAVEDNGGAGWLLWNPRNVYTTGALQKE